MGSESLGKYFRIIKAEIVMNLKDTFSYKVGFISDSIVMIILYLSCLLVGDKSSLGNLYNVNTETSKALMLQGYVFWSFTVMILGSMCSNISNDVTKGTLEQKAMSVIPLQIVLLGDFIASFLVNIMIVAIVCLVSIVFLGIPLYCNLMTIVTLIVTLIGMYGFSLIFGGIALISKRINNLVYIFQLILLLVSNSVIQINEGMNIGKIFPLTIGVELGRKYMLGINVKFSENLTLILMSLLWLIIGLFLFRYFLSKTKYKGVLSQY